jgi:hypothetical protein
MVASVEECRIYQRPGTGADVAVHRVFGSRLLGAPLTAKQLQSPRSRDLMALRVMARRWRDFLHWKDNCLMHKLQVELQDDVEFLEVFEQVEVSGARAVGTAPRLCSASRFYSACGAHDCFPQAARVGLTRVPQAWLGPDYPGRGHRRIFELVSQGDWRATTKALWTVDITGFYISVLLVIHLSASVLMTWRSASEPNP